MNDHTESQPAFASSNIAARIPPITGGPLLFSAILYPQNPERSLRFACRFRQPFGFTPFRMNLRTVRTLPSTPTVICP
jgi:hypothetical protein